MNSNRVSAFIQGIMRQIFGGATPPRRPANTTLPDTTGLESQSSDAEANGHMDSSASSGTTVVPRVNRSAIVEIAVFLSAVVLLDFMFGDGTRFINTTLHPFWIIVLLVTVQYGPIEALIAALLSSAVLLVGNLPEQSLNETMYQYILRVTFNPTLWIMTALILGSLRARQRAER